MSLYAPTLSSCVSQMTWNYLLGEQRAGRTIKIGKTNAPLVRERIKTVNADQHTDDRYVLLAAVRGDRTSEDSLHDYFGDWRQSRGARKEYYDAAPELVEYILWLRTQYFVSIGDTDVEDWVPIEDRNHWLPRPERRVSRPPETSDALFSPHLQLSGPLAGTAWAWMPNPLDSFQDYFTPPDIVRLAWQAMGGIDLDAASHFLANKYLWEAGITIPDYFSVSRSAFDHQWNGRVWLNPPYGDYLPWLQRVREEMLGGRVDQLCFLSPMWAFNTMQALPYVLTADAMVVLSPTPKFLNPSDPTKTGTNQPHAIIYWGERRVEFFAAFREVGIPCALEHVAAVP